jgi:hypothetical protein
VAAPKKKPAKPHSSKKGQKRPPKTKAAKERQAAGLTKKGVGGNSTKAKAKAGADKRKRKGPARGKARKVTKRLGAAQRSALDSQMVAEQIRGIPLAEIAVTHKLKPAEVSKRIKARRENLPRLLDQDAAEIIENFVVELQVSIGDLEAIASAALEGNNLPSAVGAKDRANKAREQLKELLQSVGALPHDLGTLTWVIDIRAVVTEINAAIVGFVGAVGEMPLPDVNRQEVIDAAEKVTGRLDEIAQSPQDVQPLPEEEGDNEGGMEMEKGEHEHSEGEGLKEGDRISEEEIAKGGHNLDERVREDQKPATGGEQKDDGDKAA